MKLCTLLRIKELEHFPDLSTAEIKELVNLEYGQTEQSIEALFQCIVRTYTRIAKESL